MTASQRGIERERKLRVLLGRQGWWTIRAAGSHGNVDVVAMKAGENPMFIEVKSTSGGPWERFGPLSRLQLIDAAVQAGAEAWLVWWPPYAPPKWIPADAWPGRLAE